MDVGFRDGGDAKVIFFGEGEIAVDVPFRVENHRLAGFLAADKAGILSE